MTHPTILMRDSNCCRREKFLRRRKTEFHDDRKNKIKVALRETCPSALGLFVGFDRSLFFEKLPAQQRRPFHRSDKKQKQFL
jgi:hypothetical protein